MKIFVAGLTLVLAFLVTGNSFAHPEPCTKDFWGNCETSRHHSRHHSRYHHYHRHRHCAADYWGRCRDGRRHHRHHHRGHVHHHHGHVHHPRGDVERGIICQPRRRVVGEERSKEDTARRAAEISWAGAVRYDYGERYQDLAHAKDVRVNCDLSTIPSRGISKLLKTVQHRCVVEATPCRAPTGSTEAKVERRYEVESDE